MGDCPQRQGSRWLHGEGTRVPTYQLTTMATTSKPMKRFMVVWHAWRRRDNTADGVREDGDSRDSHGPEDGGMTLCWRPRATSSGIVDMPQR
jgi:hypothetical protein